MSIRIEEVTTKKALKKWIAFPNSLYKDNEFYVPFLASDEAETFTVDKNPAYDFCETRLFLAYREKEIVGRIAGLSTTLTTKSGTRMPFVSPDSTLLTTTRSPRLFLTRWSLGARKTV